jgi:hypothetical protein
METNEETKIPETPTPQTPFIELNNNNQVTPCGELNNKKLEVVVYIKNYSVFYLLFLWLLLIILH